MILAGFVIAGIGESSFEYSEERMLSARERPVEHRARPRISMGTLLGEDIALFCGEGFGRYAMAESRLVVFIGRN